MALEFLMLAVHLEQGRVTVRNVRRPQRPAGFVLIRLLAAGICNTDLELRSGYYGFSGVPGHEFSGEVVEADNPILLGRRVVGEINLACGKCEWCRRGLGRHCPNRSVLGIVKHPGAFRELLTLPEVNLHILPDSISNDEAVFVEPLAAACEILDQANIPENAEIAVLGDGKLGLLIAQVLRAHRINARLFGRHRNKLRIAELAGIETTLMKSRVPAAAFDWVVEATGSQDGLRQAIQMVRPRGRIFIKSTVHGTVSIDTAPIVVNEITLIGSRCGRFEPAINLLRSHSVSVVDLISETLPLSQAPRAFARAAERGVLKVLLKAG
jgi:threonine dehydrogenase-like Zn-dependent dehydrogenase